MATEVRSMFFLELDRKQKRSYAQQIYVGIRQKILVGELQSGEKLPSTRALSWELSISRNTVIAAYEMLVSEDFADSIPGSGVYVKGGLPVARLPEKMESYSISSLENHEVSAKTISFDSGIPALDLFPRGKWNKAMARAFMDAPSSVLGYDYPQGRPEFRAVLSRYLKRVRGVECSPDQILVTTGAKQGLSLIAKCLLNPSREAWMEDPSNENVKRIFSYHTNGILPLEVDREGVRPEKFPSGKPACIFVTPSHQFPLGGFLSISRRLELIRFARETGCYLLEDDYDSEFRYDGIPLRSLWEFDSLHVIYVGTFSKILFPSLRLGYLVLPKDLVEPCREWKRLGDHHSNSVSQLGLMRFMESGDLERHILRMRKVYKKRRDILLELLETYFPGRVTVYGATGGMHVTAKFEGVIFTESLINRIGEEGVYVVPVERHALLKGKHADEILLGYAHLDPEEMRKGLERIKKVLEPAEKI